MQTGFLLGDWQCHNGLWHVPFMLQVQCNGAGACVACMPAVSRLRIGSQDCTPIDPKQCSQAVV